jgi:hypothetical protein
MLDGSHVKELYQADEIEAAKPLLYSHDDFMQLVGSLGLAA